MEKRGGRIQKLMRARFASTGRCRTWSGLQMRAKLSPMACLSGYSGRTGHPVNRPIGSLSRAASSTTEARRTSTSSSWWRTASVSRCCGTRAGMLFIHWKRGGMPGSFSMVLRALAGTSRRSRSCHGRPSSGPPTTWNFKLDSTLTDRSRPWRTGGSRSCRSIWCRWSVARCRRQGPRVSQGLSRPTLALRLLAQTDRGAWLEPLRRSPLAQPRPAECSRQADTVEQNPDARGTPVSTGMREPRHHWPSRISRTPRAG